MSDQSLRLDTGAVAVLAAFVVVALLDELVVPLAPVRAPLAVLLVGLVPGALFVTLLGVESKLTARWVVYAVACSLLVVMALGLLVNLSLPRLGHSEPLAAGPMTIGLALVVLGMAALLRRRDDGAAANRLHFTVDPQVPLLPASLAMPLLAVLGVTLLNATGENALVLGVLLVTALVPLGVSLYGGLEEYLPFGVWCLALAAMYHASLWKNFVFAGHAYVITVWKTASFSTAEIELLANAILWPAGARVAGIDIMTQLHVVNPLFVALIPVAMFATFRAYTDERRAFLGACLFVFAHPFFFLYPNAGRAATPVFFLAVIGSVVADRSLSVFQRRTLGTVAGLGIIVSHYGTSYYVMFAVIIAVVLLVGYRVVDAAVESTAPAIADGGTRVQGFLARVENPFRDTAVLDWSFCVFYVVGVVSWYLHAGGGRRLERLADHLRVTFHSLMTPGTRGSTAVRLATDYGATSIRLSTVLYVVVAVLLVVGLTAAHYRRFHPDRSPPVSDEYLALSTGVLGLFSSTFIVAGQWGGGRPMMIVFSLTAIFGVLAVDEVGRAAGALRRFVLAVAPLRYGRRSFWNDVHRWLLEATRFLGALAERWWPRRGTPPWRAAGGAARLEWHACFAVLLALMLLLNSGAAAALVLGGFAPSNVPLQESLAESPSPNHHSQQYVHEDVRTHAWLADHRDPSLQIYGDRLARAQTTDWYNGEIAALSDRPPYRFKKQNHLDVVLPERAPGYVVLLGHNVEQGTLAIDFVSWSSIDDYDLRRDEMAKVYANDHSAVYFDEDGSLDSGER